MSNITNTDAVVTESKLKDFYEDIKPFLGCPAYLTSEGTSDYYSTDEKVIGRWTDGRPVYQRTVKNTTLKSIPNNSWTDYCTVNNYNELISFSLGRITNNKVLDVMTDISGGFYKSNTLQVIARGASLSCEYGTIATFRYTKSTDSASTTIQEDSNEYSTTEKIIGKWIDGKPLYQKTITGITSLATSTTNETTIYTDSNPNIRIKKVDGFFDQNGWYMNVDTYANNNYYSHISAENNILKQTLNGWTNRNMTITIQYTKTTDN